MRCGEMGWGDMIASFSISAGAAPARALTPTLSQPPPSRREREPLLRSCRTRAPSPGWGVEGWERVGVRARRVAPGGPLHAPVLSCAGVGAVSTFGTLRWNPVASWYAFANRRAAASPQSLPVKVRLVGVPFLRKPFGTTTAGWPVRLVSRRLLPP